MHERVARVCLRLLRRTLSAGGADRGLADDAAVTLGDRLVSARRRGIAAFAWRALAEYVTCAWIAARAAGGWRQVISADRIQPATAHRRMPMLFDDLRHTGRRLRARPGIVLGTAAMLGLAVGLTTAMFTVVDALMLRPVPFADADRLARVYMRSARGGRFAVSHAVYDAWRRAGIFEVVEGATAGSTTLQSPRGETVQTSARISAGLFDLLGVAPVRGRGFVSGEGRAGTDDRAIISEQLWRTAFDADPAIVGREVQLDGQRAVIVGVMPADFRFPSWNTTLWRPIDYGSPPAGLERDLPSAYVKFARGRPDADSLAAATRTAIAADSSVAALTAAPYPLATVRLDDYHEKAIPLLSAGVGLVFLVLSANVCGLLLGRLSARRREFGTCSALGASRGRLLRQALLEHGAIGVLGAVAGVGVAWTLLSAFRGLLPEALLIRTLNPVDLDPRALAMASAAGVVAALVAGLAPAWIGTRVDPIVSLRASGRAGTETRAARRTTRALLTAEIALACTMLVGATLLVRSFVNVASEGRGLRTDNVVVATVVVPPAARTRPAQVALLGTLRDRLQALPGVERIAISFGAPPDGGYIHFGDGWQSDVPGAGSLNLEVESYDVGPDFFELYEIPLIRGRVFRDGDDAGTVIVGERLAAILWPGLDPIGRTFLFDKRPRLVIGLARELNLPSIDARANRPEFYKPFPAIAGSVAISLACRGGCPAEPIIRQHIAATSAALRTTAVDRLDDVYGEQIARPRAAAAIGLVFAAVALVASAAGLFTVLNAAVSRRRREFGIRTALGARTGEIGRIVLTDGARVTAVGLAIGAAGAWAIGRALSSLYYGVTVLDPWTWAIVAMTVAATAAVASWRPALQAMRVDPVTLLRDE